MSGPAFPLVPYVIWVLDGGLANYGGVSPFEPIGEPHAASWEHALDILAKGYDLVVLTWRPVELVFAWLDRAKLGDLMRRQDFRVENTMPSGLPLLWVTGRAPEQFAMAVALPSRRSPE